MHSDLFTLPQNPNMCLQHLKLPTIVCLWLNYVHLVSLIAQLPKNCCKVRTTPNSSWPILRWQYQPLIDECFVLYMYAACSLNEIKRKHFIAGTWRDWILARINPGSSLWIPKHLKWVLSNYFQLKEEHFEYILETFHSKLLVNLKDFPFQPSPEVHLTCMIRSSSYWQELYRHYCNSNNFRNYGFITYSKHGTKYT